MANRLFDISELKRLVDEKYINVQKHPTAELYIYNYGQGVQFERLWNEVTLNCRGLILDKDMNIVARPFKKFFNLSEHDPSQIPLLGFDVFEKLDGSMGVSYLLNKRPFIATRGSFNSVQANKANEILYSKYQHTFEYFDKSKTYIFEIIYPENRIVCDYGDTEDLILLAVIDIETGKDCELPEIGFPIVKCYDWITNISEILSEKCEDREGYVIRFRNGFRVKVKFEEYCRLHKILTQVSNKTIWEFLSQEKDFNELLDRVPDEFYGWVRETKSKLLANFEQIETEAKEYYKVLETRRETAEYFLKHRLSAVLFNMYNGKDYRPIIWKMIKPKFEKPFANNGEN